jgi:parallel beta-helix repeat protein
VISGNYRGVFLTDDSATTVEGNLIGTNVSGTAALGNTLGIDMDGTSNDIIGGTVSGARNVVSGNTLEGIFLVGSTTNVIEGNYIGTNRAGTAAVGNGLGGVVFSGDEMLSNNNIIGGTVAAAANVISGNTTDGVAFFAALERGSTGDIVEGNYIGTNAAGTGAVGNTGNGVSFGNGLSGDPVRHNVIAHNAQAGILVGASSADTNIHTTFSQNSMFANGGLGIDLAPQGVVNCTTSPPGPNDYTACPVIRSATTTLVSGTAAAGAVVEVFIASNEASALGHGEGQTFLGSATASAAGKWSLALTSGQVAHGHFVTATATTVGSLAETSEFAANVVVQ